MPHVFYLAPTGRGVGLTSVGLGMVRALDRIGVRVAFFKPIAQSLSDDTGPERSTHFIRSTTDLDPPAPLEFAHVQALVGANKTGQLLEEIIEQFQAAAQHADVVIVEGLIASEDDPFTTTLNADIVKALDAEVILVATQGGSTLAEMSDRIEITAQLFGGIKDPKVLGCVVNKATAPAEMPEGTRAERTELEPEVFLRGCPIFRQKGFRLLGVIPHQQALLSLRTVDVARFLQATVLHEGEAARRRVTQVALCARTVANIVGIFRPETLIVTPGDRDDVVIAACMSALNGVPLSGLLLTSGIVPDARIMKLCEQALMTGLPVLSVPTDSYATATMCANLNPEVPLDDLERIDRVMDHVASYIDSHWLKEQSGMVREPRLSPAAFMYSLVSRARHADKRIILPEGDEPRTVQAAAICSERNIAQCVLLGKRAEIYRVAEAQGVTLPPGIEILDPEPIRHRYIEPMVALRKHKGLTPQMAEAQLEDNVVLATMMLALDEMDGLVSGAVHTTANTVRPAMQLIKTAPDARLISSVFFMCLPDGVLVYGDCAINPNPNAEELADIAIQSANSATAFGIEPRVAMISYSTGSSGFGEDVDKVREATRIAKERRPDLLIDGPLQYDAASVTSVARSKAPESPVAGRATVLIFPDLNTGNTTYKAVQRSANVISIGPMLQGLRKPVNDLSRGALVDDIVYTIALTAIQADANQAVRLERQTD